MMPSEPRITVNGQPLTEGESMTVRVALECFAILQSSEPEKDQPLSKLYLQAVDGVRRKMGLR